MRFGKRGVTMIELIIVIVIVAIMGKAFSVVMAPMMNSYFSFPSMSKASTATADLIQTILEGDNLAKGLRFTGIPCAIGGGGGGGSKITTATTAGTVLTLTYNYVDADYCGSSAARTSHTVTLSYDSAGNGVVTRAIDGGTAQNIPNYVSNASDVNFSVSGGGADLFHYYDSTPSDLGANPTVGNIRRVDIDVIGSTGAGPMAATLRLKSAVDIKNTT